MISSPLDARNETWDRLLEVFAITDWATLIGYASVNTYFQGREMPEQIDTALPHIKAFIRHADGGNESLTNFEGKHKYASDAILIIQCFGPVARGDGLEVAVNVATICRNAFQGYSTPSCVWFRRCRIQEEDPSGNWDQCNMYGTLTYDEVH